MRLRKLQHVSSPFPEGAQDAVRSFYGQVLGLWEIQPPASLAHLGVVWFEGGPGLELHFFPASEQMRSERHFCVDIEDLEETRSRLAGAGLEPYDATAIPNRPRFFCRDPFGNLIEFTRIVGDYS